MRWSPVIGACNVVPRQKKKKSVVGFKAKMHAIINQAITIPSHVGLEDAVTQLVMSKAEAAFGATPFAYLNCDGLCFSIFGG